MKVKHVLCLLITLQHLLFCNSYRPIIDNVMLELPSFVDLKKELVCMQTSCTYYLPSTTLANPLQLLPIICNNSLPFINFKHSCYLLNTTFQWQLPLCSKSAFILQQQVQKYFHYIKLLRIQSKIPQSTSTKKELFPLPS